MNEETQIVDKMKRLGSMAAIIGVIAMIFWFVGLGADKMPDHPQVWTGYLFGFIFWGSITIGSFGFILLFGALKASWGVPIIRIFEAAGGPGMLLLLLVMFIPLGLPMAGLHGLYSWSIPSVVQGDAILQTKSFYMNVTGFWVRAIAITIIWIIWATIMKRSTERQDETLNGKEWALRSNWGSPGLVMFFLTASLISTDWAMSINPHYFSTIYPLLFVIGSGLSALSLAVMVVLYNADKPPFRAIVTPKLTKDFGNVLFTLTMLWAYMTLSQFLITWQGNLPNEAQYYVNRTGGNILNGHGDWNFLSIALLTFQFFVPFLVLIAPRAKRMVKNMIAISMVIFLTRIINVYWSIIPDLRHTTLFESLSHWTDYAAFLGIGGIWFAVFAFSLAKLRLMPAFDTRLAEVDHHAMELEHA